MARPKAAEERVKFPIAEQFFVGQGCVRNIHSKSKFCNNPAIWTKQIFGLNSYPYPRTGHRFCKCHRANKVCSFPYPAPGLFASGPQVTDHRSSSHKSFGNLWVIILILPMSIHCVSRSGPHVYRLCCGGAVISLMSNELIGKNFEAINLKWLHRFVA